MSRRQHHSEAKAAAVKKRRSITAFATALMILCGNAMLQPIGFASAVTEDLSVTETIETVTEEMTEPPETEEAEENEETEPQEASMQEFRGESEMGILVTALAAEGVFPADTVMTVTDISYEEALEQAEVTEELAILDAVAVDIMFTDAEGEEIEPDGAVEVHMELPEEQKLEGESFGLLHLADTGMVETLEEADVSGETACFVTESFSIYVMTSWGEKEINTATKMFNGQSLGGNTEENRFAVHISEEFEVSADFEGDTAPEFIVDSAKLKIVDTPQIVELEDGKKRISGRFLPIGTGNCEIKVGTETFYLASKYPINLLTAQGEIDKDRLHEYLKQVHGGIDNDTYFITDEEGTPIYLKNFVYNSGSYKIVENDEIILVSYTVKDDETRFSNPEHFTIIDQTVTDLGNGFQRVSAVIKAENVETQTDGNITFGSEKMYFQIKVEDADSTHADIEIADGGTYTRTSTVIGADGKKVITTTIYDACVADVNHCYVYDKDHNVIQSFETEDYYRHGNPGESQYELTSNYILQPDKTEESPGLFKLDNGDVVAVRGDRNVKLYQIDTTTFDVQLLLIPREEIVTDQDDVVLSRKDISDQPDITIDNVIFEMNHQSVIDAYNKCPLHSGLDFTIKADLNDVIKIAPATLSLEAKKELTNGTVNADSFEFELLDKDKQKIAAVKNDADGKIVFPEQVYLSEGEYVYYIREVIPETADKILYDTTVYKAVVNVTKSEGEAALTAAATYYQGDSEVPRTAIPTFENKKEYTLPDTGGCGTLPFTFGGIGLMLTAGVLLHKKRHASTDDSMTSHQ